MLVESYQTPLLCFLEASYLKTLMEQETSGQEMPQELMYGYSWQPFGTCPFDMSVSLMKLVSGNSKISGHETAPLKCQIIRISELSDFGVKEFCSLSEFVLFLNTHKKCKNVIDDTNK